MSLGSAAGVRQLDGANWHFQVTKNDGISIAVVPTIWLTPVLPYCQEFQDDWNPKIAKALCVKMLEKSKVTHPANFKRVAAAKLRPITKLIFYSIGNTTTSLLLFRMRLLMMSVLGHLYASTIIR